MRFNLGAWYPRLRGFVFCGAATCFAILGAVGILQSAGSRQIVRRNHDQPAEWQNAGFVEGMLCEPGRLSHHIGTPASTVTNSDGRAPTIRVDIPHSRWGYALNIGIRKGERGALPRLEVCLNGMVAGTFQVRWRHTISPTPEDCHEIDLPVGAMRRGGTNSLTIRNVAGGKWQGRLLLVPCGRLRVPLMLLLPLVGGLVLLMSGTFTDRRWRHIRPLLFFIVVFVVYYYTSFSRKMAPMGGFVWDDTASFVRYVMDNTMVDDMRKHMLFLPVTHALWEVALRLCRGVELFAVAVTFAFIAAINVSVCFLWLRRWFMDETTAVLLTVLYAFSFSIWMYSSLIESYIFSSLLVNLFACTMLFGPFRGRWMGFLLPALVVVAAGLAHPPLLILVGLLFVGLFGLRERWIVKAAVAAGLAVIVVAGFLLGQAAIRKSYESGRELSLARETGFVGEVVGEYADVGNMTGKHAGNVALGKFAYSIGGFHHGFQWYQGWTGFWDYFTTVHGALFALCLMGLWVCAVCGVCRSPWHMWKSLQLFLLVLAPYLVFFWYFNPGEMLLYSAPLLSIVLAWFVECGGVFLGERRTTLLAALALCTLVVNTIAIESYH